MNTIDSINNGGAEQINLFGDDFCRNLPSIHDGNVLRETAVTLRSLNDFEPVQVIEFLLSFNHTDSAKNAVMAHNLLDAFGSLKGVLTARAEQLQTVAGVNRKDAALISMMYPMMNRIRIEEMEQQNRICNSREAESFCLSILGGQRFEQFNVIALNAKCGVLGIRKISDGSLSECSAYPRVVMETALNYNAHSVLLTHNHPGGTCAPSAEDIASTVQLQRLLNGVGILVLDHIIVAGDRTYSMIQHGDIDYRAKKI